jgi:hypothetical protein
MNDLDPKTRPAYLRRITIRDRAADTGEDAPVHVGDFVLLDDEEHKGLVWLAEGWTAEGSSVDGSIVSFYVDASRATIGRVIDAATGKFDPFCLDGIPVLVPRDCEWEIVERDDLPDLVHVHVFVREFQFLSAPDPAQAPIAQTIGEAIGEASMCWSERPTGVFDSTRASGIVDRLVARFSRAAAPSQAAGDRVTDGGIVGTLVRCEECSGDGLLLKPDRAPMLSSPDPQREVDA